MADAHCTAHIYLITNRVTGKQYVGQTYLSVRQRWRAHRYQGRKWNGRPGTCRLLHSAIREYGADVFTIEPLLSLLAGTSQCDVDAAEASAITTYSTLAPIGYNLTINARGPGPHTQEARAKISAANKGKRLSQAHIEKIRASKIGKPRSPETRAKISAALTGRIIPAEIVAKASASRKGKRHSLKHRENLAKAIRLRCKGKPSPMRGVALSPERREKVRVGILKYYARQRAQSGSARSAETIKKLSDHSRALWASSEFKARMCAAHAGKPWSQAQRAAREK